MHEWMNEEKRVGGIEAGRKFNMELEGGGKKAQRKRGKIWKSNFNNIFDNTQHSHLDHRAEFAGPQPSHILWN